jgi:hypothetical protein
MVGLGLAKYRNRFGMNRGTTSSSGVPSCAMRPSSAMSDSYMKSTGTMSTSQEHIQFRMVGRGRGVHRGGIVQKRARIVWSVLLVCSVGSMVGVVEVGEVGPRATMRWEVRVAHLDSVGKSSRSKVTN